MKGWRTLQDLVEVAEYPALGAKGIADHANYFILYSTPLHSTFNYSASANS